MYLFYNRLKVSYLLFEVQGVASPVYLQSAGLAPLSGVYVITHVDIGVASLLFQGLLDFLEVLFLVPLEATLSDDDAWSAAELAVLPITFFLDLKSVLCHI